MIDLYCERLQPGLLDEPLNAFSNLAFILAAVAAWRMARRLDALSPPVVLLIGLMASIGIGSGLFHSFATRWAYWADVIPIALFQLSFLVIYGRQVLAWSWLQALLALAALIGGGALVGQYRLLLNGSIMYLPALLLLLGLGVAHWRRRLQAPAILLSGAALLLISLLFRTLDLWICPRFAPGTHFIWHLCNGGVLYLLMVGLIRNRMGRCDSAH